MSNPFVPPTVTDFKTKFLRDFNYAPSTDLTNLDYVTDTDIQNAIDLALANFAQDLFGDSANQIFFWLAAFYLVYSLQTSAKGITSQSRFPIESSSVGGVSVSFAIPEEYTKNPNLNMFTMNGYGLMYLNLAYPYTIGNVDITEGTTTFV